MSAMKNDYVEGSDKANYCDYQNNYHSDCTTVDNCDEYQTVGFETGQVTQRTHASVEKDDQHCQHCHQYIFLIVFMMVRTLITVMYIIFLCHNCCGEKSAYFPPNDNNNDNFILYFNYDLL